MLYGFIFFIELSAVIFDVLLLILVYQNNWENILAPTMYIYKNVF